MSGKTFTTAEAAKEVGITRATLQEWIRRGKIVPPTPTFRGAVGMRVWSESRVAQLRREKSKLYRKGKTGRPRQKS